MATNPLFSSLFRKNELNIFENASTEVIKNFGIDVIYIPKVRERYDEIFNEFTTVSFREHHTIEMYPEEMSAFMPKSAAQTEYGFGLLTDTITFSVSKKAFQNTIPNEHLHKDGMPNEGDLIYIPQINHILKINKVNHPNLLSTSGSNYFYYLECSIYISNGEKMPESLEDFKGLAQGVDFNKNVSVVNKFPQSTSTEFLTLDTEFITTDNDSRNDYDYGVNTDSEIITSDENEITIDQDPTKWDRLNQKSQAELTDSKTSNNKESIEEKVEFFDPENKFDNNVIGDW